MATTTLSQEVTPRLTTPRAAAVAGIIFALLFTVSLLVVSLSLWVTLLFPAWVLLVSVYVLLAGRYARRAN